MTVTTSAKGNKIWVARGDKGDVSKIAEDYGAKATVIDDGYGVEVTHGQGMALSNFNRHIKEDLKIQIS